MSIPAPTPDDRQRDILKDYQQATTAHYADEIEWSGYPAALRLLSEARAENTRMRFLLAGHGPCPYGEPSMGQCSKGFPGCGCADDLYQGFEEFWKRGAEKP